MRSLGVLLLLAGTASAGSVYEVTAQGDGKAVTYQVKFGGGRRFEQFTAFDPVTKTFVYLTWPRDGAEPKAAGLVWDHRTGATVKLYQFPGAEHPLPVIPSADEMKVCPLTGDKKAMVKRVLIYD